MGTQTVWTVGITAAIVVLNVTHQVFISNKKMNKPMPRELWIEVLKIYKYTSTKRFLERNLHLQPMGVCCRSPYRYFCHTHISDPVFNEKSELQYYIYKWIYDPHDGERQFIIIENGYPLSGLYY